jgi:hypothetical protein
MQIITYSSEAAKPEWRWVAYIVLPNGEYLGVMFRADSEDAVKAKAEQFWAEHYKPLAEAAVEAVSSHHMAGKVWVKNLTTDQRSWLGLGQGWPKVLMR